MALKGWMSGKGNGTEPRNARSRAPGETEVCEPSLGVSGGERPATAETQHLGPYQALMAAIREELEQFVTSQLRLHLAIAERDRYVLASIEVECEGSDDERELMRRFMREFRPEQIKHYLAKEVIAGLRNASAIDLSQFAGLNAESEGDGAARDEERYGELIAELSTGVAHDVARPYRVTLVGRWAELDVTVPAAEPSSLVREGPRTPLAARALSVDIEDASGVRQVELTAIVPGRRYAVGKGEGCDIVVDGVYASRRHCEIWFEKGGWWVSDSGSTNGIRVESNGRVMARNHSEAARQPAIELAPGTWLVLAADMQGEARQYPRLSLRPVDAAVKTKQTSTTEAVVSTPVTPIAPARRPEGAWTITSHMASGVRTVDLGQGAMPFRIGRSRSQALVVDWAHAEVSGRHLEIVALDNAGATVVVHGDNGVSVEGAVHGPGTEFRWEPGQTLQLGQETAAAAACTLILSCGA